ncbi:hypothetical protein [Spirosoma validum]|uniref:hypothetical protein n=1 Tax=Spirosoma validum TaxID=2771355 RepID=UPI00168B83A7|nr:hypothetical protein [Spirosoma validum]
MVYTLEQIIVFLASLPAVLAATFVGAVRFRYVTPALRTLCLLISFAFLTEIVSRAMWLTKTSNLFLWPVYTSVEFGLLIWMYSLNLGSAVLVQFRIWLIVAFVSTVVGLEFFSPTHLLISNAARLIESVGVIILTLVFFYRTFQELIVRRLEREPMFWVSSGLLLFFSGNLFVFIFANFVLNYSQKLNYQLWIVHAVLNAFLYSAYTYALWISPKK